MPSQHQYLAILEPQLWFHPTVELTENIPERAALLEQCFHLNESSWSLNSKWSLNIVSVAKCSTDEVSSCVPSLDGHSHLRSSRACFLLRKHRIGETLQQRGKQSRQQQGRDAYTRTSLFKSVSAENKRRQEKKKKNNGKGLFAVIIMS